jgi:hypothetical protein
MTKLSSRSPRLRTHTHYHLIHRLLDPKAKEKTDCGGDTIRHWAVVIWLRF